jgi:hypothetical protein
LPTTPREPATLRQAVLVVALSIAAGTAVAAQPAAPTPCPSEARLTSLPPDPLPRVRVWEARDLPPGWRLPDCVGWPPASGYTLAETAGSFAFAGDGTALLGRLGRVSRLAGFRYWSAADQEWRPLFTEAVALSAPDPAAKRSDFTPEELKAGGTYYVLEGDGNPLGPIVQALTIYKATPIRLVANMRNVSTLRFLGLPVVSADQLQTFFDLERRPGGEWSYYSLAKLSTHLPEFLNPSRATLENRAVAIFRFVSGYPDTSEPPLAPTE